ncbi:unnamed protein product, partial [Nesidiocoris tenuis]
MAASDRPAAVVAADVTEAAEVAARCGAAGPGVAETIPSDPEEAEVTTIARQDSAVTR